MDADIDGVELPTHRDAIKQDAIKLESVRKKNEPFAELEVSVHFDGHRPGLTRRHP